MKYHYEYLLICVDMCMGGCKKGPYRSLLEAKTNRPQTGLWKIERRRVYEKE